MRVFALILLGAVSSSAEPTKPLVPRGLGVTHVLVAQEAAAISWFRSIEDHGPGQAAIPRLTHLAFLRGVDEADVVALHIFTSNADPTHSAHLLVPVAQGHHGALLRMPREMIASIGRAKPTPKLLEHVNAVAATLSGEAKPVEWAPLTVADLAALIASCGKAGEEAVYLNLSE